jgi:hypothetical protein
MWAIIVLSLPSVSIPDATSLSIISDFAIVYDVSKYAICRLLHNETSQQLFLWNLPARFHLRKGAGSASEKWCCKYIIETAELQNKKSSSGYVLTAGLCCVASPWGQRPSYMWPFLPAFVTLLQPNLPSRIFLCCPQAVTPCLTLDLVTGFYISFGLQILNYGLATCGCSTLFSLINVYFYSFCSRVSSHCVSIDT